MAAAVRAKAPECTVVELEREPSELIEIWPGAKLAVIIDSIPGEHPGRVHRFEVGDGAIASPLERSSSTHGLDLVAAIELARSLGRLPRRLVVIAIEGQSFEIGDSLSPQVRGAIPGAVDSVRAELSGISCA